jgi:diaminohydroxyphosphoribosylaminopyrimidine deaminase/5-amino-6-(5-phosphoribosylamino)uracil reductase
MAAARKIAIDAYFDRRMMAAALRLGRTALGLTHPNPAVGCIIVRGAGDKRIVVGRGATAPGGRPHAERIALAEAGSAAHGATAYVTLEPCAHNSKAGPCAAALIEAGVARVVTAMADPDPRTSGAGHEILEAAGIAVTTGVLVEEAARAHSGHIARIGKGRPHVTLKLAVSADGMIGRREGERMLVSGKPAFEVVQAMRTAFDAIMVGIGTVLVDDPRLTVRLPGLARRTPVRVVLDGLARMSPTAKLLQTLDEAPVKVFVMADAPHERVATLAAAGAETIAVGASAGRLDLGEVLSRLAEDGFTRVLAEGGAEVASSLVTADLVDEIIIIRAPVVVGPDGVRALGGMALSAIERSPRYLQSEIAQVGEDVMRTYVRAAA